MKLDLKDLRKIFAVGTGIFLCTLFFSARAACPTIKSGFVAYQADIDLDGVPDILFRPKPLVIIVPLGDDDLMPLVINSGLMGFNVVSGGGSGSPLGPIPSNATQVQYQASVTAGIEGGCGVFAFRSITAGMPTLIVSFDATADGSSVTPRLLQTLGANAAAAIRVNYTYDANDRLLSTRQDWVEVQ